MKKRALHALAFAATAFASIAAAAQTWQVTKTLPIGGEGGMDYISIDSATHRLFVPRSTHAQVIDATTGKVLADIPGLKAAHGIAVAPAANRGFISDGGGEGAVVIFDLTTYAVLGRLTTVPDTDGIIYDAQLNRVLTVSGDKGTLMSFDPAIDPKAGRIAPGVALGGAPEFLATDGQKVYVNLQDKDVVAVVDIKAGKVLARWPVAPGGKPVGLSIDRASHTLFIGCRGPQKLVALSTETGKVISSVPVGVGVDATSFDNGLAFASARDGALTIAASKSGQLQTVQTVTTPIMAKTLTIDPATHTVYLPTNEYEPQAPGATTRPKARPGTFEIVVVSQK